MAVQAASLSTLSALVKVHQMDAVEHVIAQHAPFWAKLKSNKNFKRTLGGRQMEFPYKVTRANNVAPRLEGAYLPGVSATARDDIDSETAVTATINRKRIYSSMDMDGLLTADSHGKYMFTKGDFFENRLQEMSEDFARQFQLMLFGDETGQLGTVASVSTVSTSSVLTMNPVTTVDARGVLGTQRIQVNMKLGVIQSSDWASSPRAACIDSTIGPLKVTAVSDEHDVGATPTVTVFTDGSNLPTAGDVLVLWGSRTAAAGGAASGASLASFSGLFNFIDDGTLSSTLYGLTRATYPILNSKVDLSASARALTHKRLQALCSKIERKIGKDRMANNVLLSELSVRDAYVPDNSEAAKRYIQEDKALKAVTGFNDVQLAFLGNSKAISWVVDRDFPYGHAMLLDPEGIDAYWDRPLGMLDNDGLTIRQNPGKDQWLLHMVAYGEFVMQEPWRCARLSGLTGYFGET